jgi:hypothetical protein
MTDSQNKFICRCAKFSGAAVLLSVLSLVASASLMAQQQTTQDLPAGVGGAPLNLAPRQLVPPAGAESGAEPFELPQPNRRQSPSANVPIEATAMPIAPENRSSPSIEVDFIQTIDPDTAGTLTQEQGGFGTDLWSGTKWSTVKALFGYFPVDAGSPAMRALMRRLLLTAAAVPEGKRKPGAFIALRIKLLTAMGDLTEATDLLASAPGRETNASLARIELDARFLLNDNARACTLAAAQITKQVNPYWEKAFIFCQALAGEHDKASLGIALLRETGNTDAAFFRLASAISGEKVEDLTSLPNPTPLHLAMARVAKAKLPADIMATGKLAVLRTVATNPYVAIDLRLEAAERAESSGALPVELLRQLYTGVNFSPEELANPLSKAEAETGALSRALLYRTSLVQTVPMAKATAVAKAYALGREGGRYASTVRAFALVLNDISTSTELAWFAPDAIRAYLVSGEPKKAEAWIGLLRAVAGFDESARTNLIRLLPLARLAGVQTEEPWTADVLMKWWEVEKDSERSRERAILLFTLLEAVGEEVPLAAWEMLLNGPERTTTVMPSSVLWERLKAAAESGRIGETITLALLALGEGGPGEANPIVLRGVMKALRFIALDSETSSLAVEAAVAARL